MRLQLVLKCDELEFLDLTTGIREFFEFYLTFSFPGHEGVPGIPLASSKGKRALESPHFLGTRVALGFSPRSTHLQPVVLFSTGLPGLEQCLKGFD